jgi:lipopolysaccharide export LptBFGC system permease protein LptF
MQGRDAIVTFRDERGRTRKRVLAGVLRWDLERRLWVAESGRVYKYVDGLRETHETSSGEVRAEPLPIPAEGEAVIIRLTPTDLGRPSRLTPIFLTLEEVLRLSMEFPDVPLYVLQLCGKITFPLASFLIVLAGLPFVLTTAPRGFFKGLALCFLVVAGYYVLHFACFDLGQRGAIPPVFAAFLPSLVFLVTGLVRFATIRT